MLCFLLATRVNAQIVYPNMEEVCKVADCSVIASNSPKIGQGKEIMEYVAYCESRNDPLAKNPNSSASGRFQFLKSSWNYYGTKLWGSELKNKNVFDYKDNTELAMWVYERNGLSDWQESKPCWSKYSDRDV